MEHLNTKDLNSVPSAQTVGLLNWDDHDVIDLELCADNTTSRLPHST